MRRWTSHVGLVGLVLVLLALGGCKQQCFVTECDFEHYKNLMPPCLEADAGASHMIPASPAAVCGAPATVLDPDRPPRYISLAECIAMSLERGTIGIANLNISPGTQFGQAAGFGVDQLVQFVGNGLTTSDALRVLALEPARAGAAIEGALSQFDAYWTTSMTWNNTDRPVGTALDAFQARGTTSSIETQQATLNTAIIKPLPTGGIAGITFRNDYQFTNLPARVNPSYTPTLQFGFEQPLLQYFGVEINQLLPPQLAPTSVLFGQRNPYLSQSAGGVGILINRIRFDQSRAEFERLVSFQLINVEVAYWSLYSSYWTLYAREQALRLAYESWRILGARYAAGKVGVVDLAQTRGQYELFRSQRLAALGQVLENERQLRKLIGLPVEDGCRLVPCDEATLSPFNPDWCAGLEEALALRPELVLAREQLKNNQLNLILQRNNLLPDLRFFSTYDINSIGSRLDGPDANNALRNLSSNHFNNWQLGLRLNVSLGYRAASVDLRRAKLELAQSLYTLQDQEYKARDFLALRYRRLFEDYEQIRVNRAQREAYGEQLRARFEEIIAGKGTPDILLEAQRFWADALVQEFSNIGAYNAELAGWEFAKGTLLQHDNVSISEGALPQCAYTRAVDHIRSRDAALVEHQRANPVEHQPCDAAHGGCGLPQLPSDSGAPLPSLFEKAPKLPSEGTQPLPGTGLPNGVVPLSKDAPAAGSPPALLPGKPVATPATGAPPAPSPFAPANSITPTSMMAPSNGKTDSPLLGSPIRLPEATQTRTFPLSPIDR
jgi:outer membrane protein TolC